MANTADAQTPTHRATDAAVGRYVADAAARWAARGIVLRRHAPATFASGPVAWQCHIWVGRSKDQAGPPDRTRQWPAVVAVRCDRATGTVGVVWSPRARRDEGVSTPCPVPSGMGLALDQVVADVQTALGTASIRDLVVSPESASERRRREYAEARAQSDADLADLADLFGGGG